MKRSLYAKMRIVYYKITIPNIMFIVVLGFTYITVFIF